MKIAKILLMPVMIIFLLVVISASSVTVSLFYDATASDSLTIINGNSVDVIVSADSIFEDSMTIKLDLLDANGNVLANILNTYTTSDSYSKSLTVGQSAYSAPGNYTIKGTVTANSGQTAIDTLSLEVLSQPVTNHAPVITSTPLTQINEGQNYFYLVTATDADDDTLTYSLTQNPTWISINSQTGKITGTSPNVSSDTPYVVTIKVSDGKDFVMQSFTIMVKNVPVGVNYAPIITSTPLLSMYEGNMYIYQLIATDADGDTLAYSLTQNPSWLSISNTGRVSGPTPQVNADTNYPITISVSDGKGGIATQTYILTVKNDPYQGNHIPVITSTPVTQVNEGQNYFYQVIATDSDNDVLSYLFTQAPNWISISNTGAITGIAPNVDLDTQYLVVFRVSDGKEFTYQNFIITVKDVPVIPPTNSLPVITSTPANQIDEGLTYTYRVIASDADVDTLIYSLTQNPAWLSIDGLGLISGPAPEVNSDTAYPITIRVSDGKDFVTQSFALTVKNVPAPIITVVSPVNGQTYTSSNVLLEMTTNKDVTAAWYVLDNLGNSYINRAPNSYNHFIDAVSVGDGTHHITFYVRDFSGHIAQSSVITFYVDTFQPPPTNSPPVITSIAVNQINEGQNYNYQVIATDADGDTLTYSLTQAPSWLSINSQTGRITGIAPNVNLDTLYPITIRVSDGRGGIATQSYTLTVRDVSPMPNGTSRTGKNIGAKEISNKYETDKYLSQFEPKTTTEEEEVLGVEEQPSLLSQTLWIWLLGVGILIFVTALIILWMRR